MDPQEILTKVKTTVQNDGSPKRFISSRVKLNYTPTTNATSNDIYGLNRNNKNMSASNH